MDLDAKKKSGSSGFKCFIEYWILLNLIKGQCLNISVV